jgi:hypothetical protein
MTRITPVACPASFIEDASVFKSEMKQTLFGLREPLRISAFWSD